MEEYESIAHAKTRLRYHIIFSTKYRRKCLNEIKEEIFNSFKYAEEKSSPISQLLQQHGLCP